jgi:starch synthase (maltosyl-transferring)
MYELEDVVKFTGWRSDAASLIRMADVLVLASRWEGLPNVILEAQAAGTPVIASAVDGCLDLVDDQLTGRLFEPGNAERLATGLLMQITQPHKAARMAHEARQQIRRQCSWDVCIDSYDQLLQRLLSATDASGQQ